MSEAVDQVTTEVTADTVTQETAEATIEMTTATAERQAETPTETTTEKMYTKKELDEELQKSATVQYNEGIKAAAKKAGVDTRDPKKIKEWLSAIEQARLEQLSENEKKQIELDEALSELSKLKGENQRQTAKNIALSLDCDPKQAENVVVLALARVTDEITLEQAVTSVMTEITAFKRQVQVTEQTKDTPPPLYVPTDEKATQATKLEEIMARLRR